MSFCDANVTVKYGRFPFATDQSSSGLNLFPWEKRWVRVTAVCIVMFPVSFLLFLSLSRRSLLWRRPGVPFNAEEARFSTHFLSHARAGVIYFRPLFCRALLLGGKEKKKKKENKEALSRGGSRAIMVKIGFYPKVICVVCRPACVKYDSIIFVCKLRLYIRCKNV